MSDTTDNEAPEANTVTVRLMTNPHFAYKGQMFRKLDDQSRPVDYEVDEELASELCDTDNARFRRIGDDGEVIKNDADIEAERSAAKDRDSRTTTAGKNPNRVKVDHGKGDAKADAKTDDTDKDDGKAEAKPAKKVTIKSHGTKSTVAADEAGTDGAVEA